ncbi:hypothetical protein [Arthrobacter psychrolactophilus]
MFQPGGENHAQTLVAHAPEPNIDAAPKPSPAASPEPDSDTAAEAAAPPHLRDPAPWAMRWTARSWLVCGAAVLASFAGAAFCLLAVVLIPDASSSDPSRFHGVMVFPWGYAIVPGASALFVAGLGMVAGMLFLASRYYLAHSHWLRAGLAVVGLAALAGGTLGMFSMSIWPEMYYDPTRYQSTTVTIPWIEVMQAATLPLLVLGLAIMALLIITYSRSARSGGAVSGKAALLVGAFFNAAALWCCFAMQLFPLQLEVETRSNGAFEYPTTPWPQTIMVAVWPLSLVGTVVFLGGVLLLATSKAEPRPEIEDEA